MSKSVARIDKVVIIGRDAALWLAANVLWSAFHRTGLEIVAVELPSRLRAGDVIPTLSNQPAFHELMGIDERPLMAATQATYSLGQRFADFADAPSAFMQGYGPHGEAINNVPFHHYWIKARMSGLQAAYDDFSLNAVAARQGRFFVPEAETGRFAGGSHAYHLPAVAYCRVLKQVALQRGVTHIGGDLGEVSLAPETGDITAVSLADGCTIEGDFFIDATGADSQLLGGALETKVSSWAQWFPCDRLLTTTGPALQLVPAYSQVSAFRSGWVGLYPLRDRTAIRQAYSSAELSEQGALDAAARVTSMRFSTEPVVTPYTAGRRQSIWRGNCVGIGEAAAVFDPIGDVGIQVIMAGLAHLTVLFPIDRNMTAESAEYNRNIVSTFERIRDHQICPYKLNRRQGQPLWARCRDTAAPDALAYKIDLFEARGYLVEYDDETFAGHDWHAMFLGHGLIPRAYDPAVDQTSDEDIIQRFHQMLGAVKRRVEALTLMEAHLQPRSTAPLV